jgi:hypothetical protein
MKIETRLNRWRELAKEIKAKESYESTATFSFSAFQKKLDKLLIEKIEKLLDRQDLSTYRTICNNIFAPTKLLSFNQNKKSAEAELLAVKNKQEFAAFKAKHQETNWICDIKTLKSTFNNIEKLPSVLTTNLFAVLYTPYSSFDDYCIAIDELIIKPEAINEPLLGEWVSVVRSNDGIHLFFSLVEIKKAENQLEMLLHGKNHTFGGKIKKGIGFIQAFIEHPDKSLLLSFRVGVAKQPLLLKGTFSGVTSDGTPIAGVELLVRKELLPKEFHELPQKIDMQYPPPSYGLLNDKLRRFFIDFSKCYIKMKPSANFDYDDLRQYL